MLVLTKVSRQAPSPPNISYVQLGDYDLEGRTPIRFRSVAPVAFLLLIGQLLSKPAPLGLLPTEAWSSGFGGMRGQRGS